MLKIVDDVEATEVNDLDNIELEDADMELPEPTQFDHFLDSMDKILIEIRKISKDGGEICESHKALIEEEIRKYENTPSTKLACLALDSPLPGGYDESDTIYYWFNELVVRYIVGCKYARGQDYSPEEVYEMLNLEGFRVKL